MRRRARPTYADNPRLKDPLCRVSRKAAFNAVRQLLEALKERLSKKGLHARSPQTLRKYLAEMQERVAILARW